MLARPSGVTIVGSGTHAVGHRLEQADLRPDPEADRRRHADDGAIPHPHGRAFADAFADADDDGHPASDARPNRDAEVHAAPHRHSQARRLADTFAGQSANPPRFTRCAADRPDV